MAAILTTVPNPLKTVALSLVSGDKKVSNDDLRATHSLYNLNLDEWNLLMAAYDGVKSLLDLAYLTKHERESAANWLRRKAELFSFGYAKSVVDLFTFYLFKRDAKRDMGSVGDLPEWKEFVEDCDLYGNTWNEWLLDQGRYASIYGHVGILVDKPQISTEPRTRAQDKRENIYPYVAAYTPTMILDWRFERQPNGRPELVYIKLKDDDGYYRLWWRDRWEVWFENIQDTRAAAATFVAEGPNPLGEIPFVWLYNTKSYIRPLGKSDIHDVARVDISIIRNASQIEEIINYAAFPLMRKPMQESGKELVDEVGPTAILEFDPEHPESKPDWLPASVSEPVGAILQVIERKVAEIYRAANVGGMASMELSPDAKSGVAIQAEFQLLNSKLVGKAINLEKAEKSVIWYWTRWQDIEDKYEEVKVERPRSYDVQNLAADLANAMTAVGIVKSDLFGVQVQKNVVRQMLPAANDEQLNEIDEEIEAGVEEKKAAAEAAQEAADARAKAFEEGQVPGQEVGTAQAEGQTEGTGEGQAEGGKEIPPNQKGPPKAPPVGAPFRKGK